MFSEITRLALTVIPAGFKLKHMIAAMPGADPALIEAVHREAVRIRALRDARWARRLAAQLPDPLLTARATRLRRTPSALAKAAAKADADRADALQAIAAAKAAKARAEAVRASLLRAGRITRGLGFIVQASKDRAGRISSYYVSRRGGRTIRISDHAIPATYARDAREFERENFCGFTGFRGAEIIIDRPRSSTWIRRRLILAEAGR